MQNSICCVEVQLDFNAMSQAIKDIKENSKRVIKEVEVILYEDEMEVVYENI